MSEQSQNSSAVEDILKQQGSLLTHENILFHKPEMFWCVYPVIVYDTIEGPFVQLQWGWTTACTPDDYLALAEDAPKGYMSVSMKPEDIYPLILKLQLALAEIQKHDSTPHLQRPSDQDLHDSQGG